MFEILIALAIAIAGFVLFYRLQNGANRRAEEARSQKQSAWPGGEMPHDRYK